MPAPTPSPDQREPEVTESRPARPAWPPVVGVCGPSGSGKTLLVSRLVERLTAGGLRLATIKHCSHRLDVDRPDKDSDRLFRAGTDVLAAGPAETLLRLHVAPRDGEERAGMTLGDCLASLPADRHLVLVEGYREMSPPQICLEAGPDDADEEAVRARVEDLLDSAEAMAWDEAKRVHASLPLLVVLLQEGVAPGVRVGHGEASANGPHGVRLLPAVDAAGPLAGILSALRWQPKARWLATTVDPSPPDRSRIDAMLAHSRPGVDAVLPALDGPTGRGPLLGLFEPTARPFLERAAVRGIRSVGRALADAQVVRPSIGL